MIENFLTTITRKEENWNKLRSFYLTKIISKCSVFVHDTIRVVQVTLRFFILKESFDTLKLANRKNKKRKDNKK